MPCIVNRETSIVPIVFLGLASIFLILSCVSAPLVDGVRIFRVTANIAGARRFVDFDIWGYCVRPIRGLIGFDPGVMEGCSPARLGYTIGEDAVRALRTSDELRTALLKAHTSALVLFPIATVYTLITFLISITIWFFLRFSEAFPALSCTQTTGITAIAGFGTLLTTATFGVALSVMVAVKSKVSDIRHDQGNLELRWDSIIWLSAFAAGAHLYNLIFVNALRKQRKNWPFSNSSDEEAGTKPKQQKKNKNNKQGQKPAGEKEKKGKKGKKVTKDCSDECIERRESASSGSESDSDKEDVEVGREDRSERESVDSGSGKRTSGEVLDR